jgi:hypothetical protein
LFPVAGITHMARAGSRVQCHLAAAERPAFPAAPPQARARLASMIAWSVIAISDAALGGPDVGTPRLSKHNIIHGRVQVSYRGISSPFTQRIRATSDAFTRWRRIFNCD